MVLYIEKHYKEFFFGLVVINILRITDEIEKYYIQNRKTIPLTFELINFLQELKIPLIIVINKIDKVSNIDKRRIIKLFLDTANEYSLNTVHLDDYNKESKDLIPYLEISALKKINIGKLKQIIQFFYNKY